MIAGRGHRLLLHRRGPHSHYARLAASPASNYLCGCGRGRRSLNWSAFGRPVQGREEIDPPAAGPAHSSFPNCLFSGQFISPFGFEKDQEETKEKLMKRRNKLLISPTLRLLGVDACETLAELSIDTPERISSLAHC